MSTERERFELLLLFHELPRGTQMRLGPDGAVQVATVRPLSKRLAARVAALEPVLREALTIIGADDE